MAQLGIPGAAVTAGLIAGGSAGDVLAKETSADEDTVWQSWQYPLAPGGASGRWVFTQLTGGSPGATVAVTKQIYMPVWFPEPARLSGLAANVACAVAGYPVYFGGAGPVGTGAATKPGSLIGYGASPNVPSTVAQMAIADLTAAPITFPSGWSYVSVGCASTFSAYGNSVNPYRIPPGFNDTDEALAGTNYLTFTSSTAGPPFWYDPTIVFAAQGATNLQGITIWMRYA